MTKTKKSTIQLSNGTTVELSGEYDFKTSYTKWKGVCEGISSAEILSVGKEGRPKPVNLYLQLDEHVTDNWVRPNSTNKGKQQGAFKLLAAINESMTTKKLYTGRDLKEVQKFIRSILRFKKDNSYNPQNIYFTRPAAFEGKGKELEITDDAEIEIYGHYADDYFVAKYPDKKQAPTSWYNKERNTAKPPLFQALFGGTLVTEGLLDVLLEAEAQIKNMKITHIRMQPTNIKEIAKIPSVVKRVNQILANRGLFNKGKPRYKLVAEELQNWRYVVGEKKNSKKVEDSSDFLSGMPEIETFSLVELGAGRVGTLLAAVVGKQHKMKSGYYLDIKGKTVVPETPEVKETKEVKKSWIEQLWRD
tara:strand:- start:636 stop:1718 length:1083 start_codon:yes stop_codon:yes gene_type:complete